MTLLKEIIHIAMLFGRSVGARQLATIARSQGSFEVSAWLDDYADSVAPPRWQELILGSVTGFQPWVGVDCKPLVRAVGWQLDYERKWGLDDGSVALRADLDKQAKSLSSQIREPNAEHES